MNGNKFIRKLKNKSGASMIFVLGIMMLLMIIGASALAAVSSGINQSVYNQLEIYAESAQKSIMYSLQTSRNDIGKRVDNDEYNTSQPQTLGGQIIKALYLKKNYEEVAVDYELPTVLELKLDGNDIPITVNIEFDSYDVNIIPFAPYVPGTADDPGTYEIDEYVPDTDAEAKSASISAEVTFKIKAEQDGKSVTYAMTYQLTGVALMMGNYSNTMTVEDSSMIIIGNDIIWRVVSYDKIEN